MIVSSNSFATRECPLDVVHFLVFVGMKKIVDNTQWVNDQFSDCDLGDSRRTKRLQGVAKNMLDAPDLSLPQQNTQWTDLKAAYRLFDRSESTFEAIATPHWQRTRQTKPGRYLLISDTTDIDHFSHSATTGLGMLGDGRGRGMQLHNCLMYDSDQGQIIGEAGALLYYRKHVPKKETRMQRLNRYRESSLWGDLVDRTGPAPQGSQWIHVFDRGGDNFESMCHIQQTGCDWVIRGSKLNRKIIDSSGQTVTLKQAARNATCLGRYELSLRSRPGVAARTAKIRVSAAAMTFPLPSQYSKWVRQCGIKQLTMNMVVVEEVDAPQGVTPIHWVLLTSLAARTFDQAWQVIEDYEHRWLIEEYHKVLKTGCGIERHALRTADRLEPQIALTSIVGIRLFQLKLIGRNQPEAHARTHVPSHWLRCMKLARPKLRLTGLTVYMFFRELAKMGGFLARKGDGEPGWQTIWRGYQKLQALLAGMELERQSEQKRCG